MMNTVLPHFARKPLSELAALGMQQTFTRNQILIREGDPGDSLFVLLEGQVRIFTSNEKGHRFVFGTAQAGAIFGEGSLDGGPRTASVEALTHISCSVVAYPVIRQRIANDTEFAMLLIDELIARSRMNTGRMKSLALETVYQRLRSFIVQEARPNEQSVHILGTEWTQQAIANHIGSSRDMVTRIFRELARGDYIVNQHGTTLILKPLPKGW